MATKRFIFTGPPGSGKGTQGSRMSERFQLMPMSSGDTLRNEIKAGSEVGKKAQQFVQAGTLVPDEVITGVMLSAIRKLPHDKGFILDGFPRTAPQAESLTAGLRELRYNINAVIDFQIPDNLIIDRIVSRRVCGSCGATYNVRFFPPKKDGVCDKCGGPVKQRVDDTEAVVKTRLETYRAQTAPLIQYYEKQGLLRSVDASLDAAAVEEQVVKIIETLG
jgi:adenylate kinase